MIIYSDNKLFWKYLKKNKDILEAKDIFYDQDILKWYSCDYNKSFYMIKDKTFLIIDKKNRVIAFFFGFLFLSKKKSNINMPYYQPCSIFVDYKKISKDEINIFFTKIKKILKEASGNFYFRENLANNNLSSVVKLLKKNFLNLRIGFYKKINLLNKEDKIFANFSGNLKREIKHSLNKTELKITIINHKNVILENILYFKKIHYEVSGYKTRSDDSWNVQYELIKNNKAFIVQAEFNKEIISMAYFTDNSVICNYSSSVSLRKFFNIPVNHLVIWNAIIESKKRNCRYFCIGEEIIEKNYSEKEVSINFFKDRFYPEKKYFIDINI